MKRFLVVGLLLFSSLAFAQNSDQEMVTVTVPKSSLTPQQQQTVQQQEVHNWVGIGKEVGDAVNSSLQAITTQSNNFAQTGIGKLTVAVVIWKVIGDQVVHVVGAILWMAVFLPIWLWSYRRMCMTRRIKTGKDTWQVVEYDRTKWRETLTPRGAHSIAAVIGVGVALIVMFTY